MITALDKALDNTISRSRKLASDAPEAKINVAAVVSGLNDAQAQWLHFATSECGAARELVGIGQIAIQLKHSASSDCMARGSMSSAPWVSSHSAFKPKPLRGSA